jgi:hypothetical protein
MNKIPISEYKNLIVSLRRIVTEIHKRKQQNRNQTQNKIINKKQSKSK